MFVVSVFVVWYWPHSSSNSIVVIGCSTTPPTMTQEDWPTPVGSPSASSKDDGKRAFIENRFSDALGHYLTAIDEILTTSSSTEGANSSSSNSEHQILLSNVVACRLKIGGTDMIAKAVEEAKKVR